MSTATLADWRAAADRIQVTRPEVGVCVVPYGVVTHGVSVEVTELGRDECVRCEQPLPTQNPGPTDVIDARTGRAEGGWSHQHGCGAWNSPQSVRRTFDLEEFAADDEWDLVEILDEKLAAMVGEVDDLVAEEREVIREWLVADLKKQMRDELDHLAAGGEDRLVQGDTGTPGIFRDTSTGKIQGWAPLYGDLEGVFVSEEDL